MSEAIPSYLKYFIWHKLSWHLGIFINFIRNEPFLEDDFHHRCRHFHNGGCDHNNKLMILNVGLVIDICDILYHNGDMANQPETQQVRVLTLLRERGLARATELTEAGITRATLSRMIEKGLVLRLGRGLYQLSGATLDTHHSLAEASKMVPRGVICLVSALAFHELTDTIPSRIWMAIGAKDRKPQITQPPIQFVRFNERVLRTGIESHSIEGANVQVYSPAKTIVDLFRYRQRQGPRYQKSPGLNFALEGLREALRQRKATPADIARYAEEAGVWRVVQPYLEAMIANG